jgi:hypothetical protein
VFVSSVIVGFIAGFTIYLFFGFFIPKSYDNYLCKLIIIPTVVGLGVGLSVAVFSGIFLGHKRKLGLSFFLLTMSVIIAFLLCLQH